VKVKPGQLLTCFPPAVVYQLMQPLVHTVSRKPELEPPVEGVLYVGPHVDVARA
jgi:hypothetical protein